KDVMKTRRGTLTVERVVIVAFAVLLTLGLWVVAREYGAGWESVLSAWQIPLVCVLVPYYLWCFVIATVDLIHHTHPRAVWFADASKWNYFQANVESTTRIYLPLGLHKMFHNILEHAAHHVDPRIPLYHLPDSQRKLRDAFPGTVPEEMLLIRYVWRIFRTCQLYDYDKQQWLDYQGKPTSEAAS
ncbi:MAG TPA: fatty acid desaturase, partial [Gemmataceae bacterium]|nr:fatty acid desaturase [Gemmataceae bacterium]